MKLNKRAGLLILPVLSFGYLLAFLGVYHYQKAIVIELEKLYVELQIAELSDTFGHYSFLAKNYLYTFMGSGSFRTLLTTEDARYRALAVDGSLDDAMSNLGVLSSNHVSVAVINSKGVLEYYYEDSIDPFSEFDPRQRALVEDMFRDSRDSQSAFFDGEIPRVCAARIVDRSTLKPPLDINSPDAVAVIVGVEATKFTDRFEALSSGDRQVEWFGSETPRLAGPAALISASKNIPPYGQIRVSVPPEQIARKLADIKYVLTAAFLLITLLSYFVLGWLIRRNITLPINRLERSLSCMNYDSNKKLLIHDSDDEIGSLSRTFAGMYEDLRKSYQIAREMAERDGLTRLYNRRMFNHFIERILTRAESEQGKVALLYIDVDNFKYINDKYGHGVGDELLRTFSDRLLDVLRPSDLVCYGASDNCSARLAGDEFAVILYDFDDNDLPRRVAERVLSICNTGYLTQSVKVSVSLSIGVACFPADAENSTELISNADSAMYQAKNGGKNQFSFFSRELAQKARRVVEIETGLKHLNYNELVLNYMPIVDSATRRIVGVEALVRWESKTLGLVSPAEFIPIAETTGAFREIDRWVITHACDDLPLLQQHFGADFRVSVNISSAELESLEFIDEITMMVQHDFIKPESMELEITETFHINHRNDSEEILARLRALGFSISIDDFGTGYTSLVQLVEYAIDKIKLDKTFVDRVLERGRIEVISSLVQFCKSQNFGVTAEGVESAEQAESLFGAGCDYLQGFYFSKPVTLAELIARRPCAAPVGPVLTSGGSAVQRSSAALVASQG